MNAAVAIVDPDEARHIYTGTIQREELENSEYELRRQYDFITLLDIYGENHRYLAQDFTDILPI